MAKRADAADLNADKSDRVAVEMKQLEEEVRGCPLCPLATTRTHAVPGEGPYDAVVMFVGEGPGADEDAQGRPFVGRSGQFLTRMLENTGIRRDEVYITNIVKCRPPQNRDPQPNEIFACAGYLDRQIALINPRIIVTLGRHSMQRWFPGESITKVHGQVRNIGHGRVALAMFHPAAALRNPKWRDDFEKDMQRLPGLIERAKKANAAALRGEALPAGAPHSGDGEREMGEQPESPSRKQRT
jgi:DNA polymerase